MLHQYLQSRYHGHQYEFHLANGPPREITASSAEPTKRQAQHPLWYFMESACPNCQHNLYNSKELYLFRSSSKIAAIGWSIAGVVRTPDLDYKGWLCLLRLSAFRADAGTSLTLEAKKLVGGRSSPTRSCSWFGASRAEHHSDPPCPIPSKSSFRAPCT